ncbi:MAG: hypothetical protein M1817_002568 [Caeruleum heppii]|nr:MAG: hypothetical protein M1817_002568 [Caeruleum heppii]
MSQQGDNMRSSTPQKATAASTHHHHHHHHRHGHQHRTATPTGVAKTPTTPTPIITRQPTTTILTQPLLNSIAHLPRHHLGSALYSSVVRPSTATKLWSSSDHLGFATTPLPLPRFEGKENCTFTVRIPSFLLLPHVREEVVRRRAVWGSEVYTDDSDVLGAAIHAGFVRGDWGEGVDGRELLELSMPAEAKKQSNGEPSTSAVEHLGSTTTTAVPSTKSSPKLPPRPAPHHALHVTILVLPALQTYASTTSFGLRSRTWDETHDGMSFTILKVDWVDERLGDVLKKKRGLGSRGDIGFRGAEGKRKRLKVFQDTGRLKVDAVRLKAGGFSEKIGTGQEKGMRGRMWSLGVVH